MKKTGSVICIFLAVVILTGLLPSFSARAAADVWDGTVDISWYDPEASEYYLSTPAQLAGLAALVNGMADPSCPKIIGDKSYLKSIRADGVMLVGAGGGNVSDTVYTSEIDFAFKTVYLTADMDMGGKCINGVWSGPNWTPIGGKFPMLPSEATGDCLTLDTRFNGVFDGQGHTVYNIYCERYADKGFPYSMAVGLIGYLGGTSDTVTSVSTEVLLGDWIPTCRNVVVGPGYIRGRRMVGGVVGRSDYTTVIENCANMADVYNTDAKGIGGIIGTAFGGGVIRNCYNSGKVTTSYADCPAGGIVGTNQGTNIYNCYNVGKITGTRARDIGCHDSGSYTVTNCYFLEGMAEDSSAGGYYKGTSKRISISITGMSESEMKSFSLLSALNANGGVFTEDNSGINKGYPVLWFQNSTAKADCRVKNSEATNGMVSVSAAGVPYGSVVSFSCLPFAGYTLDYYTVNGNKIEGDFYTATGDITVSAVFKLLGKGTITIPESEDYYVAVARDGLKEENGEMLFVYDEMLTSGDTVFEGNVLKVLVYGYKDAKPADPDYEFIDAYSYVMNGCVKNSDNTYTYNGAENLVIQVNRTERKKQWVNLADTSWYYAAAKKEYILTTAEQLAGLAWLVNKEGITFDGIKISLGNDISLSNSDGSSSSRYWTPIGSNAKKTFKGIFDGCGFGVFELSVSTASSYSGLFGVCTGAEIRNLSVYGSSESSANSSYAGGLAASLEGCTVENCFVYADVRAAGNYAGGLAAYITGGTVIKNSFFIGNVTGSSGIGGIAGFSDNRNDEISSCAVFGSITSTGNASYGTGGISGKLNGTIMSSAAYCSVSGTDRYTGGIAGYTSGKNTSTLENCSFYGTVSSEDTGENSAKGSLVGYAQFLRLIGCSAEGTLPLLGMEGTVKVSSFEGTSPEFEIPERKYYIGGHAAPYTVTFMADGKVIGTAEYSSPADKVTAPHLPEKEGCRGYWESYVLSDRDITVNAVYREILVRGGETVTKSGTYYIAWFSSGKISIADGLSVKLIGDNGPFTNLIIAAGKNTRLTIENLEITGDSSMLLLSEGCTLTLSGTNKLFSNTELTENRGAAVAVSGSITVNGDGELFCSAAKSNSAINITAPNSVFEIKSGTVSVFKDTLLGFEGGAFYAPGSEVNVSGGTLRGYTNNDNVRVIYADKVTMTAGRIICEAAKSPVSISGVVSCSGGSISVYGHSGSNAESNQKEYRDLASVPEYSGTAEVKEYTPFRDIHAADSFFDDVVFCYDNGLFSGTGETTFSPDASMTRAMFVTVLYRLAGSPSVSGEMPFTDCTRDWYKAAVSWAVSAGITSGTSATTFSPNDRVTRQQAAKFIMNYADYAGIELTPLDGSDTSHGQLASWATEAVETTLAAGLFGGIENAMTVPTDFAPRSMLATVLHNYRIIEAA